MSEPAREQPKPASRLPKGRLRIVLISISLILVGLGVLVVGNWFTGKPQGLGATNGRLAKCPDSPNCVCSQEVRDSHHLAPLQYEGDGRAAFSRLVEVVKSWPGARIVTQTNDYLHAEFTTPVWRFVDDGEFLLVEEDQVIHVRSASRVGYSDLGANRKRMEQLRTAFESAEK